MFWKLFSVILIVTICGITITSIGFLNYHGFCWPERRFLNDHELIEGFVADRYNDFGSLDVKSIERALNLPVDSVVSLGKYQNVEEFYSRNIGCCTLASNKEKYRSLIKGFSVDLNSPSNYQKVFGKAFDVAVINRDIPFVTKSGEIRYYKRPSTGWVSACGDNVPLTMDEIYKYYVG